MRTGKTPTALSIIERRKFKRVIIICPKSTIPAWKQSVEDWTSLKAYVYDTKNLMKRYGGEEVIITNYEAIRTGGNRLLDMKRFKPECVLLDEAHRICNRQTAQHKVCVTLGNIAQCRIALTGTPAPNHPEEVYGILKFLAYKEFKSYWKFIDRYFITAKVYKGPQEVIEIIGPNDRFEELQYWLDGIATQRKRKDVMPWLPDKDVQDVYLTPSPKQVKYLTQLKTSYKAGNIKCVNDLDRLIRYRQICTDPRMLSLKATPSPKIDWLKDFIKDYPEKPIIIFSKFKDALKRIKEDLKADLICGETSLEERKDLINKFQTGKIRLLLCQIDAVKEGVTLDKAEAAIFLDEYPPVADILQAEDRGISTTEANKDKPYIVYKLILKGTYDEEIKKNVAKNASAVALINNFKEWIR